MVLFPAGARYFLFFRAFISGPGADRASPSGGASPVFGLSTATCALTSHLSLMPWLKISGVVTRLQHTPLWLAVSRTRIPFLSNRKLFE